MRFPRCFAHLLLTALPLTGCGAEAGSSGGSSEEGPGADGGTPARTPSPGAATGSRDASPTGVDGAAPPSRWLYVWAGDAGGEGSDFLVVLGAHPDSADYGTVVATAPVGLVGMAHHTEHVMPEGGRLFANSFQAGATFVFDLRDPREPAVAASLRDAGPYTYPHSFVRLPNGHVLATFQNRGEGNRRPGGLVELDTLGGFVRGSDAANPVDPEVRPYSLAVIPELDRAVSTTSDMRSEHVAGSVQIWRLSDLELLHTLRLPHGPSGNEGYWTAEPRVLSDGRTVVVSTFTCGLHLLEGLETEAPEARLVRTFPFENPRECALPVVKGRYWVQTVATTRSLVSLDMSDPAEPRQVDELVFGPGAEPHWISLEPGGDRIVVTGVGSMHGQVFLVRMDPETGELSFVDGGEGGAPPGPWASFDRDEWPHGAAGPARPHGAVFSRR